MTRRSVAVAGLGATVFALWFVSGLQWITGIVMFVNASVGQGSGGIGAVSAGLISVIPDLLLFVAAVVANRLIAAWAWSSGALERRLHLAHSIAILAVTILSVVFIAGVLSALSTAPSLVMLIGMVLIPVLLTAQYGIMSILLALFTWRRRKPVLTT